MGKKSKVYKSGLPRKIVSQTIERLRKEALKKLPIKNISQNNQNNQNNTNNQNNNTITENIQNKNNEIKMSPNVTYNLDALQKSNDILGLTAAQIQSLYSRPLRNRRPVHNLTLTKREKKKELRKMRKNLKQKMEEKTKLDITMNPNLHQRNKIMQNLIPSSKEEKHKIKKNETNIGFHFDEMNGLLNDMMEEEEKEINKDNKNNKSSIRVKKQRNLIYNEANQINNMLNNKEFINNPNEALKMQIQETHKQNEKNRLIREDFNQKYNLLNLK